MASVYPGNWSFGLIFSSQGNSLPQWTCIIVYTCNFAYLVSSHVPFFLRRVLLNTRWVMSFCSTGCDFSLCLNVLQISFITHLVPMGIHTFRWKKLIISLQLPLTSIEVVSLLKVFKIPFPLTWVLPSCSSLFYQQNYCIFPRLHHVAPLRVNSGPNIPADCQTISL